MGDPKTEGYDAFRDGKRETDNPYLPDTDEHLGWNKGFKEAYEDDILEDHGY